MKITKKARLQTVRDLLDRYEWQERLNAEDLQTLRDMTETPDIESAWKQRNPKYPDKRHLYVTIDGVTGSFSWNNAIKQPSYETRLKKSMRMEIEKDLADCLDAIDDPACERCGSVEDLTVDHAERSFDSIAEEFIELQGGDIPTEKAADGVGWWIADMATRAAWIAFHAGNSVYQILCRSCNASKGKRECTSRTR